MLNVNDVTRIYLGIQGENGAQTISIDVKPWLVAHPGGSVSIWHKRNGDDSPSATGATFDSDTGIVSWTPTSTDTYVAGEGEAEIRLTVGTVIKKSRKVITGVSPAVTLGGTTLGSGWQDYINAVDGLKSDTLTAKEAAEDAASDAEAFGAGTRGGEPVESGDDAYHNNAEYYKGLAAASALAAEEAKQTILGMTATATGLSEGSSPTVSYSNGVMAFGIPKGEHASISSETEQYQISNSGTTVPTGEWLNSRPDQQQGKFLWIKRTRNWSGGESTVNYESYYTATDGQSGTIVNIDNEPTSGSQAVPRSGGTYTMIQTKAKKVTTATENNFAAFDDNGDLKDSGHKHSDYLTSQDISGKADKVSSATNGNFAGLDENGNLTDSGHKHSDYLTSHQDISGKADKVSGATSGNFAGLDGNGNLTDSGKKDSDYAKTTEVETLRGSIAIVIDGDTAPQNITSGQYLFIKNHSTLATGGYHATEAITSGSSITSSNVSADSDGIANAINDHIADSETIYTEDITVTGSTNKIKLMKCGKTVIMSGQGIKLSSASINDAIPSGYRPMEATTVMCLLYASDTNSCHGNVDVSTTGTISFRRQASATSRDSSVANYNAYFSMVWFVSA